MTERWVSQQRKFCRFCNCWFADNRASIETHENGASHQANVEKELIQTRKNKADQAAAEKILKAEMQRIELVALKALEEDARRDPFAKDELDRIAKARSSTSGK